MATTLFRLVFLLLVLAFGFLAPVAVRAEESPDKDPVRFTVDEVAWGPDGNLSVGVTIHAPLKRDLKLFQGSAEVISDTSKMRPDVFRPISLADSYLVDGYTGNKIMALQQLSNPYFGPLAVGSILRKGSTVNLGVSFPAPPPPPPAKDGSPQPYKLTICIPLDAAPVAVNPPSRH